MFTAILLSILFAIVVFVAVNAEDVEWRWRGGRTAWQKIAALVVVSAAVGIWSMGVLAAVGDHKSVSLVVPTI